MMRNEADWMDEMYDLYIIERLAAEQDQDTRKTKLISKQLENGEPVVGMWSAGFRIWSHPDYQIHVDIRQSASLNEVKDFFSRHWLEMHESFETKHAHSRTRRNATRDAMILANKSKPTSEIVDIINDQYYGEDNMDVIVESEVRKVLSRQPSN